MPEDNPFDIRLVDVNHPANLAIATYAFDESPQKPPEGGSKPDPYNVESRMFMSFDGDQGVARLSIPSLTMNVRGTVLPMGGIGGVATMPSGRRGGRVRALMIRSLEQMREDGQPVSTLYPFKESFYERLGYVTFPAAKFVNVNPANLTPLLKRERAATSEHLLIADGFDTWMNFLRDFQRETHGFSIKHPTLKAAVRDANRLWLVLVREGSDITGAMTYRITGHGKPMAVDTFLARTHAARYQLLEWIARHADQVPHARIRVSPADTPELWWRDMDDEIMTHGESSWGAAMGRIVSLNALSGIGAGDGEVAIDVTDDHAPWNTGTWTLRGSGGQLDIAPGGNATSALTIQGLSALVFNGIDPAALPFRGWGTLDPATTDTLRSLFPPASPYLHELF